MKTIKKFLENNPSYHKKGTDYLAEKTGLKYKTVDRYKKTEDYKQSKKAYLDSVEAKYKDNFTMVPAGATTCLDNAIN